MDTNTNFTSVQKMQEIDNIPYGVEKYSVTIQNTELLYGEGVKPARIVGGSTGNASATFTTAIFDEGLKTIRVYSEQDDKFWLLIDIKDIINSEKIK